MEPVNMTNLIPMIMAYNVAMRDCLSGLNLIIWSFISRDFSPDEQKEESWSMRLIQSHSAGVKDGGHSELDDIKNSPLSLTSLLKAPDFP